MITNVGDYLKSNDVKPSYQRIKILEFLMKSKDHPTVDTIYRNLISEIPTLSKTTVYNTLKLFIKKKITTAISIENSETRFDADMSVHGHFKCEKCDEVFDFDLDISNLKLDELKEYDIKQTHIYIRGICKNCKNV